MKPVIPVLFAVGLIAGACSAAAPSVVPSAPAATRTPVAVTPAPPVLAAPDRPSDLVITVAGRAPINVAAASWTRVPLDGSEAGLGGTAATPSSPIRIAPPAVDAAQPEAASIALAGPGRLSFDTVAWSAVGDDDFSNVIDGLGYRSVGEVYPQAAIFPAAYSATGLVTDRVVMIVATSSFDDAYITARYYFVYAPNIEGDAVDG
jgi:hypothetical protein